MTFIKYIPLTLICFFLIKYLISYFHEKTIKLKGEINNKNIINGMISSNDLQQENYIRFIEVVKSYLAYNNFRNISVLPNGCCELTNILTTLYKENILITCIQNKLNPSENYTDENWIACNKADIQSFVSRVLLNSCSKGILITNSFFEKDALKFAKNFNENNKYNLEIQLINGYELTKGIRSYSNYLSKVVLEYENR